MRSATRPFAQWNRIFAHLQLSKTLEKHENKKQFELNVYFFVFSQKFIPILINQSATHLELYQLSLNMFMFTKTNICWMQNFLRGNSDRRTREQTTLESTVRWSMFGNTTKICNCTEHDAALQTAIAGLTRPL